MTSVPSVPFVEAILLFRDAGHAPLGVELVAQRLYVNQAAAREIITQLRDARIVQPIEPRSECFVYRPETAELGRLLDMLATIYRTHLVEVTDVIHSKSARQAHQFSEAFKLKRVP